MSALPGNVNNTPYAVINFPKYGEYFGSSAYVSGFLKNSTGVTDFALGTESSVPVNPDGSFFYVADKAVNGFTGSNDGSLWYLPVGIAANGKTYSGVINLLNDQISSSSTIVTLPEKGSSSGSYNPDAVYSDRTQKALLSPKKATTVSFGDVTIEIPEGAVDKELEITITPLHEDELPPLDNGMTNVTRQYAGYRFLPHGNFKKPVKIHFNYDEAKLEEGQVEEDVFMYYYHNNDKVWKQLNRTKLDKQKKKVESEI